jgi:hypothetical protein
MADTNAPRPGLGNAGWWIIGVLAAVIFLWILFAWGTAEPA